MKRKYNMEEKEMIIDLGNFEYLIENGANEGMVN